MYIPRHTKKQLSNYKLNLSLALCLNNSNSYLCRYTPILLPHKASVVIKVAGRHGPQQRETLHVICVWLGRVQIQVHNCFKTFNTDEHF